LRSAQQPDNKVTTEFTAACADVSMASLSAGLPQMGSESQERR
jgi:hypothetical protein